ncbi:MAG TPA: hypothetical protein PKL83_03650 [bacterium]|nr:hypothetical protein [bacterium]
MIVGVIDLAIVDSQGRGIREPRIYFSRFQLSGKAQRITARLGDNGERIRIVNPNGIEVWTVSLAAADGPAARWQAGRHSFDYNDPSQLGHDADGDQYAGVLAIDTDSMGVAGIGATSVRALLWGDRIVYQSAVVESIDIIRAYPGADRYGGWELWNILFEQLIPPAQPVGDYRMDFVLTFM